MVYILCAVICICICICNTINDLYKQSTYIIIQWIDGMNAMPEINIKQLIWGVSQHQWWGWVMMGDIKSTIDIQGGYGDDWMNDGETGIITAHIQPIQTITALLQTNTNHYNYIHSNDKTCNKYWRVL